MAQTVRDVMTPNPRTCPPDATVHDVAQVMRDDNIGDVLIVKGDRLTGIVTDRDIVVRSLAEGRDPKSTKVTEIASGNLETLSPDEDAQDAARRMRRTDVRRLPVAEGGRPVGIVSLGDLAIERDPESALADISSAPSNR